MFTVWLNSLLAVFIISLISLVGILTIYFQPQKLNKLLLPLVSFAAGALLGGVFIHLLPEIAEKQGFNLTVSLLVLLGILLFFVLEKIVCWRHCHLPFSPSHPHSLGIMNLIGDSLHNFTDGVAIAAAFMVSSSLGLAAALAVGFHELPQELGDFSVLIYAGFSKTKALLFNFLSALTAVLGAVLTLVVGSKVHHLVGFFLPITAGGFLYIASADLIPELKKEQGIKKSFFQLASLLAGILIMGGLKFL